MTSTGWPTSSAAGSSARHMVVADRRAPSRTGTVLRASLDQALHRCIVFASRFGTVRLARPDDPERREFELELDEPFAPRLRWRLRSVEAGTELTLSRTAITRLAEFAWRGSATGRRLDRRLRLLPHMASLKIAVIGGGTGLYTTLLSLRDRTWSLTAVISGLPRGGPARDQKDHLGTLPRDDAGICLVGLTPTVEENVVLRSLLNHRMESGSWRGAHLGSALLAALEEIHGSRQAALDSAAELLGIRGRIVRAIGGTSAAAGLLEADMIVIAPGHLEHDLAPVLCCPGVLETLRKSAALKVVVTKIMTAEDSDEAATTSQWVRALSALAGVTFDIALANSGPFTPRQLRAYAAAGARPIQPDPDATRPYAREVRTQQLAAAGDLARHDPEQLGETLVEIGAEHLMNAWEAELQGA
jgi:2-phospho-L-lactate transferase/gluconeogenesis factor (CofD/UPF0052 family)